MKNVIANVLQHLHEQPGIASSGFGGLHISPLCTRSESVRSMYTDTHIHTHTFRAATNDYFDNRLIILSINRIKKLKHSFSTLYSKQGPYGHGKPGKVMEFLNGY